VCYELFLVEWKKLMTAEEVLHVHRNIFYRSLIKHDYDALADLYATPQEICRVYQRSISRALFRSLVSS
jgi:hypothetical protein